MEFKTYETPEKILAELGRELKRLNQEYEANKTLTDRILEFIFG